jgi:hypothetical protein
LKLATLRSGRFQPNPQRRPAVWDLPGCGQSSQKRPRLDRLGPTPARGAARGSLRGPDDRPNLPVRVSPTRRARTGRTIRVGPLAGAQFGGDQHVHAAGQAVRGPAPRRGRSATGSRRPCSGGASCDVRPRPRRPRLRSVRSGRGATRPRAGRGPARATRRLGAPGRRAAATGPAARARWRPRSARLSAGVGPGGDPGSRAHIDRGSGARTGRGTEGGPRVEERGRRRVGCCGPRDAVPCAGSGAERAGGGVGWAGGGVRRAPRGVDRGWGRVGCGQRGVGPARGGVERRRDRVGSKRDPIGSGRDRVGSEPGRVGSERSGEGRGRRRVFQARGPVDRRPDRVGCGRRGVGLVRGGIGLAPGGVALAGGGLGLARGGADLTEVTAGRSRAGHRNRAGAADLSPSHCRPASLSHRSRPGIGVAVRSTCELVRRRSGEPPRARATPNGGGNGPNSGAPCGSGAPVDCSWPNRCSRPGQRTSPSARFDSTDGVTSGGPEGPARQGQPRRPAPSPSGGEPSSNARGPCSAPAGPGRGSRRTARGRRPPAGAPEGGFPRPCGSRSAAG